MYCSGKPQITASQPVDLGDLAAGLAPLSATASYLGACVAAPSRRATSFSITKSAWVDLRPFP